MEEEVEEGVGLRVWAWGAEKPKLELGPAGDDEAALAATTGPGAPPDFWANRVPE